MFWEFVFWFSFGVVGYAYVGYPVVLWVFARFPVPSQVSGAGKLPTVSIVIAAYNEEKVIRARIENCLALDYPADLLEVCVGSDGSTDGTNRIVAGYSGSRVRLFAYPARRGKASVLNDTVPQTRGEIVVFTDANTVFGSGTVTILARRLGDPRVGCVCGSMEFTGVPGSVTTESEGVYWKMERRLKEWEGRRGAVIGASGPNYAIRRELYRACPADTITEDFVIAMRILQQGFWIVYDAEAKAFEEAAPNTARELERRTRIGAGNFQSLFMLLPMLNPARGFPAFAFWSHKVLRWLSPHLMVMGFLANVFLASGRFYALCLAGQVAFYCMALVGWRTEGSNLRLRFVRSCHYFVAMNLGLFLGFCRFLRSTQAVTWERTER